MPKRILSNKAITLFLHIFAWVIIFIVPYQFIKTFLYGFENYTPYRAYNNVIGYSLVFYINFFWIVPKYFFQKSKQKYFLYVISTIILISLLYIALDVFVFFDLDQKQLMSNQFISKAWELSIKDEAVQLMYFYTYSILISGFSLGLVMLKKHTQNERERKELEKEKLDSELALLKNQISPHFFFNTLNNIDSLIDVDPNDAHDTVHKLSKMMRYVLYESQHELSPLSDEVKFIQNYIDLMKLRLIDDFDLQVELPKNCGTTKVHPLLFVPFVENAFKHGVSFKKESFIKIKMVVKDKKIIFTTLNSIGSRNQPGDMQYKGIGLQNVKKRLSLLYPNKHKLKIEEKEDKFTVELELDID